MPLEPWGCRLYSNLKWYSKCIRVCAVQTSQSETECHDAGQHLWSWTHKNDLKDDARCTRNGTHCNRERLRSCWRTGGPPSWAPRCWRLAAGSLPPWRWRCSHPAIRPPGRHQRPCRPWSSKTRTWACWRWGHCRRTGWSHQHCRRRIATPGRMIGSRSMAGSRTQELTPQIPFPWLPKRRRNDTTSSSDAEWIKPKHESQLWGGTPDSGIPRHVKQFHTKPN